MLQPTVILAKLRAKRLARLAAQWVVFLGFARQSHQRHRFRLLVLQNAACKVVLVPTAILMSIVLTLCAIGSFAANNSTFDIGVMAAFGLLGYLMLKAGFPQPPMLLAMILGPLAESNFRRALSLSRDDFSTFFTSPISCAILAVSACVVLKTIWDEYRGCKREAV